MKNFFLAAILCGLIVSSCKEDEKTYCYECASIVTMDDGTGEVGMPDMSVTVEQCGLTEEQAKAASSTVTTTAGSAIMKTATVCTKK